MSQNAIDNSAWQEPADQLGKRAFALAQAIAHAARSVLPRDVTVAELDRHRNFYYEVARLCREHLKEADAMIDQLTKNALEAQICRPQAPIVIVRPK